MACLLSVLIRLTTSLFSNAARYILDLIQIWQDKQKHANANFKNSFRNKEKLTDLEENTFDRVQFFIHYRKVTSECPKRIKKSHAMHMSVSINFPFYVSLSKSVVS